MNYPRVIAIAGPLKNFEVELAKEEFTIGRDSANDLAISDLLLSRKHCVIRKQGDGFMLGDLGSLNGSLLNGVPIRERLLQHGDRIQIGDTTLVFLLEPSEVDTAAPVELVEMPDSSNSTVQVRLEDSLYGSRQSISTALATDARTTKDLKTLLDLSTSLHAIRNVRELQDCLIEAAFSLVPAEQGAILTLDTSGKDFASIDGHARNRESRQAIRISRTAVQMALDTRAAVLGGSSLDRRGVGIESHSLIDSRVRCWICAPLEAYGRTVGAIYLDSTDPSSRFDENHLQLIAGLAGMGGMALDHALHSDELISENRQLQSELALDHEMVGEGVKIKEVLRWISRVAPTDATALIQGESGTGKELVARAIHRNSPRANRPFVAINCAALAESLLESELFGHEKGAFTGAIAQKKGKLEMAEGGTLFLDEVGELALTLQAKLLRVLQSHEFERVGGTRPMKADIRVIAATNRDLEAAVKSGGFRQDLYYRLNVISVRMPALRERKEDLPLLASYFVSRCSKRSPRRITGISAEARECMMQYDWPGNIRELENAIERAVVLGSSEKILPEDLPEAVLEMSPPGDPANARYHDAVREAKKQLILTALDQAGGNYTEAARILGLHPNYLHRLTRNLDIRLRPRK